MMDNITTDNQRAKQKLNTMYLDQTGANAKISVINFFSRASIPFSIASIIFSAFGFYFDLFDGLGALGAGILGIFLGFFIEGAKHYFSKGAFASFSPTWRISLAGGAFIFTVIAMAYHYKSMQTFENMSVRTTLTEQVERETTLKNKQLDAITATQKNNDKLTSVYLNGTSHDDKEATISIKSNNELAITLARMGAGTNSSNALLKQAEKTAHQNKSTLLFLFITVELFSLFGNLAKALVNSETSETVKSIVTTSEKLATLEENVLQVVETAMINNTMQRIEQTVNHSPTPTYAMANNSQNQEEKAQIAFNANSGSNSYFTGTRGIYAKTEEKPVFLPIINKRKPKNSGTRTETEVVQDDNLKGNLNSDEKEVNNEDENRVLDLMKFEHKENELIKILWENGEVKAGDKLLGKRFVLQQLPRTITERDLTNLYEKLTDYNMIEFKNGYRALVNIENVVSKG